MIEIHNYIGMIDIVSFLRGENTFRHKSVLAKMNNQNRTAQYYCMAL